MKEELRKMQEGRAELNLIGEYKCQRGTKTT